MADFFTQNIILVYFLYGLSFFSMGFAILIETGRTSSLEYAQALRPLAWFGLIHGGHEWLEMFVLIHDHREVEPAIAWIAPLRVILLAVSFLLLVTFGVRLLIGPAHLKRRTIMLGVVTAIWLVGLGWIFWSLQGRADWVVTADVYTRYALAIPGGLLVARGLIVQRDQFAASGMQSIRRDVTLAALAFLLYGCLGQLFTAPSPLFPSSYLNTTTFLAWFGFPVQVFRAVTAAWAAAAIVRSLRAFEVETSQKLEKMRQEQNAEQHRLEELRAALLHQTVKAQENERQRIARELHDELGQTLTALGMGLRGVSENIPTHPERVAQQAAQLEKLVKTGLDELQHLVTGLHPPQLDDLGLLAALRWYANEFSQRSGLQIQVSSRGNIPALSEEIRVALYRIAQEALTNAARHAQASHVSVTLIQVNHDITLRIEDNGCGFDVDETCYNKKNQPCWGLLGMIERAELIGGQCLLASSPGHGTLVEVTVALGENGEKHG
jgi:signal transduction histidine kinase